MFRQARGRQKDSNQRATGASQVKGIAAGYRTNGFDNGASNGAAEHQLKQLTKSHI